MDDQARFARWNADLSVIGDEIKSIAHVDNVFWQVQEMLNQTDDIPYPAIISKWLGITYISTVSSGLRRLADKSKGTVSLSRLIGDMGRHCGLLTCERYVALHDDELGEDARDWFVELAGGTKCDHIPRTRLLELGERLDVAFHRVNGYTNTRIAHRSTAVPDRVTLGEARRALAEAFLVYQWCSRVLLSVVVLTPVPYVVDDWVRAFTVPWIPEGSAPPAYKHLDTVVAEVEQAAPV